MADPQPFNDIAAKFPADLPAEAYDQARRRYFDEVVATRMGSGDSHVAAWEHFKSGTERKSTLTGLPPGAFAGAQVLSGIAHGLTKPLSAGVPSLKPIADISERAEKSLARTAAREGRSTLPMGVGEMTGAIAPLALTAETGGATLEAFGMEAAGTTYKLLRGGLAFGTFEALNAEEGNRMVAGAKGFATGLAFEGALGPRGKLLRQGVKQADVDKIVTKVLAGDGEVTPEVNNEITAALNKDAQASKKEARPQFIKEDPSIRGVRVLGHDSKGQAFTFNVKSGEEFNVAHQVSEITKAGGVVDGIMHHPNEVALANRFMKASADVGATRYEGARVIRTEDGHAPAVAVEDRLDGRATDAVSGNEVITQTPQRSTPSRDE